MSFTRQLVEPRIRPLQLYDNNRRPLLIFGVIGGRRQWHHESRFDAASVFSAHGGRPDTTQSMNHARQFRRVSASKLTFAVAISQATTAEHNARKRVAAAAEHDAVASRGDPVLSSQPRCDCIQCVLATLQCRSRGLSDQTVHGRRSVLARPADPVRVVCVL
jgi:hypothetical protein